MASEEGITPVMVAIAQIRRDGGTQVRAETNEAAILHYADLMRDGREFPPVTLYRDEEGNLWLVDGFHRVSAATQAGRSEIAAVVQPGSRREATLKAIELNSSHGLRFTNADKRQVALLLLQDPEWSQESDRAIARFAGLSNRFVSNIRRELQEASVNRSQPAGEIVAIRKMPIDRIQIGNRLRRELGDLEDLAHSMKRIGLINPIVVRRDGLLIVGRRRLEAAKELGWTEIMARIATGYSDPVDILEAERSENANRLPCPPAELAAVRAREEALEALEANPAEISYKDPAWWEELEPHALCRIFPNMRPLEMAALIGGLRRWGYVPELPIVLYEGKILDGRMRWLACRWLKRRGELPGEPTFVHWEERCGSYSASVRDWLLSTNLKRSHLTDEQMLEVEQKIVERYPELCPWLVATGNAA